MAAELRELEARGWRLLNDAHWPGRPKANLDHVLVGPGGILVVDAKNWTGRVELRNGRLTQNGYSRVRETTGVLEQGAAVAAVLEPRHRRLVQGWICLVNHPELRTESADGVRIVGLESLQVAVSNLPPILEPAEIDLVFHQLQQLLSGPTSPALLNTSTVGLPGPRPDFSPEPAPAFAQESALHDSLMAEAPTSFSGLAGAAAPSGAATGRRSAKGRRRQQPGVSGVPSGRRGKGSGRRRRMSRNRRAEILRLIVLAAIVVALWTFAGNANRSSAEAPSSPQPPTVNSQTADQSP